MTQTQIDDTALKAKHRAMWAMGDYPAVATEVIAALGPALVAATGVAPGDHVLDVAAGSGNAAIPAALAGADVVASDLTPDLLETGRQARGRGRRGRCAGRRPTPSTCRTPTPSSTSVDLLRRRHVRPAPPGGGRRAGPRARPGGRIGLLSWTPAGFIGQMFATMKPYAPPPPPGAQPPPLWGDEAHVRALLGDRVTDVVAETATAAGARVFADGAPFRDFFKRTYGPTIAVYRATGRRPGPHRRARRGPRRARRRLRRSTAPWSGSTCSSPRDAAEDPLARRA